MNEKKIINYIVVIFALTIFTLTVAPKLFAEHYSIDEGGSKEIILGGSNNSITISGLYKELIDLNNNQIISQTPITATYENPVYLNPNKEYKLNIYFTTSKDISKDVTLGSYLGILGRNKGGFLNPSTYENNTQNLTNIKVSKIYSVGAEKYKYVYSYIIDKAIFEKIDEVTKTYTTKPDGYDISVSAWLRFEKDSSITSNTVGFNSQTIPIKITTEMPISGISYELQIPCAIDRTQIVMPTRFDQDYSGPYKERCNSSAYFNPETNIYHLKKNEGYYLDLKILNEEVSKTVNLSEIEVVVLEIFTEGQEQSCFTRKLTKSSSDSLFHGKIGYVKNNDSEEFAQENMTGFINSCGIDKLLKFKTTIKLNNRTELHGNNRGRIQHLIIDSDNSNIVAENARARNQNQIQANPNAEKPRINKEEPVTSEKPKEELRTRSLMEIKDSEMFIKTNNSTKKIVPLTQILRENKIDSEKIIGEVILQTESENPEYIFEVKEQRQFLGFIPFGEKIIEKRIAATREIKE